jgi:hypothetical protein
MMRRIRTKNISVLGHIFVVDELLAGLLRDGIVLEPRVCVVALAVGVATAGIGGDAQNGEV